MCLAPITLSTKSGHVQACRLVHGLYMANLTKCFDMELELMFYEGKKSMSMISWSRKDTQAN